MSDGKGHMPGHTLMAEGAAYKYVKPLLATGQKGGWKYDFCGDGHGLCECGWASEMLPSDRKRRAAHREHKAEEIARKYAVSWTPVKVKTVMDALEIDATTFWDKIGGVRVTMSFRDLCSFAEAMCGSMSEIGFEGSVSDVMSNKLKAIQEED